MEINKIAFGTCSCLGECMRVEAEHENHDEENHYFVCPYCKKLLKDLKIYLF